MKWRIELKGHKHDLEDLYENQESELWSIIKYGENFYLESVRFNNILDSRDVAQESDMLLKIINGSAKLAINGYVPVARGGVWELDSDGDLSKKFLEVTDTIQLRVKVYSPSLVSEGQNTDVPPKKIEHIKLVADLALANQYVLDAISIYSKGKLSWSDLYKIQEIINDSCGINTILDQSNISKAQLKRFKHTCQSHEAIGEESRHHSKGHKKPKNPMSHEEASQLITDLLETWKEYLLRNKATHS